MNIIYIFLLLFIIYLENYNKLADGETIKLEINSDWSKTRKYNYLKNKNPEERFSFKNFIAKYLNTKKKINYYSITRNVFKYSPEIEIIKNNIVDELIIYLPKQVLKSGFLHRCTDFASFCGYLKGR